MPLKVGIPFIQMVRMGAYIIGQKLRGKRRYPLVLMLEPLFRCNLACSGCGKIEYPDEILDKRMSVEDCLAAAEECGAPVVSIPGGEPLLHTDIVAIVKGLITRKRFVYLCTNALLLERKLSDFEPTPYLTFSVHLDGPRAHHDQIVRRKGVFDKAIKAIRQARKRGFRVTVNTTLFDNSDLNEMANFLSFVCNELRVESVTIAPGYAYEKTLVSDHFLVRERTKEMFRSLFAKGKGRKWRFNQSILYLDFLAGNRTYHCTPWGSPTRNIFGWQRPCYLVDEDYVTSFSELMEETQWDRYGTGNHEKCANCMVHCGYEPTAVNDMITKPWKAFKIFLSGINTGGPMAPEISFDSQRPTVTSNDSTKKAKNNVKNAL